MTMSSPLSTAMSLAVTYANENPGTPTVTVVTVGSFLGIRMQGTYALGSYDDTAYDVAISAGTTPKTVAHIAASFGLGLFTGGSQAQGLLAIANGRALYAQLWAAMKTVFLAASDVLEVSQTTIDQSLMTGDWIEEMYMVVAGGGGQTWQSVNMQAILSSRTVAATAAYNPSAIKPVSQVGQPVQVLINDRRSVATSQQPSMSTTPGQDPQVDNGGMFVLPGNPVSLQFDEAAVSGWTAVSDADIDLEDNQQMVTIVGRCITDQTGE